MSLYLKYKFQLETYLSQIIYTKCIFISNSIYKGQFYILEKISCSIYKHHSRTITVNTYKPTTSS